MKPDGKTPEKPRNPNHPKKGDTIQIDPIRCLEDIQTIKGLLSYRPRDLLLFTMGINNGLRARDLLKLKVKDVRHLKEGDYISIRESKTRKNNVLMVNKAVYKALKSYLQKVNPDDEEFLFPSRKGTQPIAIHYLNALVKKWTRAINLKGNYGARTLRKTFGYIQRTKFGVSWEVLAQRFNHSTPAITRHYLGITPDEVNEILLHEI